MQRYCLLGHVAPEHLEVYRERHRDVWPELLQVLKAAGWHNYSLFLAPDGLLVGYVESEDLAAAQEAVARTEVNEVWQQEMSRLFASAGKPDEAWQQLELVFNLEDQLGRVKQDS